VPFRGHLIGVGVVRRAMAAYTSARDGISAAGLRSHLLKESRGQQGSPDCFRQAPVGLERVECWRPSCIRWRRQGQCLHWAGMKAEIASARAMAAMMDVILRIMCSLLIV
jgi:hypothetical protein